LIKILLPPRVNIVILNWNGYEDTSELLESLRKISYSNYKIKVVDNNSSQNDVEKLETKYGNEVQIISCKENLGFAGGNNIGIKISLQQNADFILLLNNDTTVEPNFLEILVNKFETDERAGIVAPQINYYNETRRVWSAGGKISKIRASGFADSDKVETEIIQTDKLVEFVSGCCMLIKIEVFQNVGLFDEHFFLYTEDTDFCFRARKAGYKIYLAPRSKIYHKVNRSTYKNFSLLPLYYTTRNRLYFAKKNFQGILLITILYIALSMSLKSFIWLCTGKLKNICIIYKAFKDFLLNQMGKTEHSCFNDYIINNKDFG
jgi:GT2 family glycosyltransferase